VGVSKTLYETIEEMETAVRERRERREWTGPIWIADSLWNRLVRMEQIRSEAWVGYVAAVFFPLLAALGWWAA